MYAKRIQRPSPPYSAERERIPAGIRRIPTSATEIPAFSGIYILLNGIFASAGEHEIHAAIEPTQHFVLFFRLLVGHHILLLHVTSSRLFHSQRTPKQSSEVPQHEARIHRVSQRVESLVRLVVTQFRREKILIGRKAANQIARLQIAPCFVQNARVGRRSRREEG